MSTSPHRSPPPTFTALSPGPHSRRPSHSNYAHHPQLTHRSSSQGSLRTPTLASLLGEARKPTFETLRDLPATPIDEAELSAGAGEWTERYAELPAKDEPPGIDSDALRLTNGAGKVYTSLPPSPVYSPTSTTEPLLAPEGLSSSRFASAPDIRLRTSGKQRSGSEDERAKPPRLRDDRPPELFSIWDYLRSELLSTDADQHQEMKWERVENFLLVPVAVEKILSFGFFLCLDAFLYVFTILPIRSLIALGRFFAPFLSIYSSWLPTPFRAAHPPSKGSLSWKPLPPSSKADLIRVALVVLTSVIIYQWSDASRIYHAIRGQDTIKLYVIFNAVEIGDRLLCAIGQDLMDCLFARSSLSPSLAPKTIRRLRTTVYFLLTLVYCCIHSITLMFYLVSLNVAINSYDNALLTLLLSNQFVEIKGSVFKKFEKENLFQIACADIVERFQLTLMLIAIAMRNLIELRGSDFSVLPKAFSQKGSNKLWAIFWPVAQVLLSEVVVDWLKHAFITKFNSIRVSVYDRFTDVLCRDLVSLQASRKHSFVDHSPLVSRRLGLATIPLACVMIRITFQALVILQQQLQQQRDPYRWVWWSLLGFLFWFAAVALKVLLGIRLISFAAKRRATSAERAKADEVNDFGRPPIGEGPEEQAYNLEISKMLERAQDDQQVVPDMVIVKEEQKAWGLVDKTKKSSGDGSKKKKWELEELNRWTMVKRIW